jgi:hypothetical protein
MFGVTVTEIILYEAQIVAAIGEIYRDSMRIRPVPLPSGANRILPGW